MSNSWQLNDSFSAKQIAALVLGIPPHEASDGELEPLLKRMRKDFKSAIYAHMEAINDTVLEPIDVPKILESSLQSIEMVTMTGESTRTYDYNPHRVWDWLSSLDGSSFYKAEFSRLEITKWLKANEISSQFQFTTPDKTESSSSKNKEPSSPFDPLPTDGIAKVFSLDSDPIKNIKKWRTLIKNCKRNGLVSARLVTGKGKGQSVFDLEAVGDWLVENGEIERAKVNRLLNNNLPHRSAHLKDLLE